MDQLAVTLGMINSSFSQNSGAFNKDTELGAGTVSVISIDFNYEIFSSRKSSHVIKFTGSGLAGEVSKYYNIGYGRRYYFGAEGTRVLLRGTSIKVKMIPKFRYYLGYNVGMYSIVYETQKEVRSDLGVEYGGHGGMLWAVDSKKSYKTELNILKGTGVEVASMNVQIFFGVTYFIESIF